MTEIIEFGYRKGNRVEIYEFCRDPDGPHLQWYKPTDAVVSIEGREKIAHRTVSYEGKCSDVAEYNSHLGELAQELVSNAPEGTTLVALVVEASSCGTRTFSERLTGNFYR